VCSPVERLHIAVIRHPPESATLRARHLSPRAERG
jgi:hypothetical protein